jgi:hypothetical protein
MEEEPVVQVRSLKGCVSVGAPLKARLEALGRVRGCDASYLAKTVLTRYADTVERAARAEAEGE